jgi:hypothetical protein
LTWFANIAANTEATSRNALMATPINAPLTSEIWHLSIEDLLEPLTEMPRLGGPGPFVINLSASSAPLGPPASGFAPPEGAYVYQIQRVEDRRPRYRLRLGPFVTEDEADAVLASVRDSYPSALTATAESDDLKAIAALKPKPAAVQAPNMNMPASALNGPASTLNAPANAQNAPGGAPNVPTSAPIAPSVPAAVSVAPVVPAARAVEPIPAVAPSSAVGVPPARPAAPRVAAPPASATAPVAPVTRPVAPTAAPAAMRPAPMGTPAAVTAPPPASAPRAVSIPVLSDCVEPVRRTVLPKASAPTPAAAPRTAAPTPAPAAVAVQPAAKPLPPVLRPAAAVPRSAFPARPADSPVQPNFEATQTLRPLTPAELQDLGARWYVIQLSLSGESFDPDSLPNLDIFNEYRLYSVAGIDQGRIMHALRLGFFTEEGAAAAVASYLGGFYDKPTVKRISVAERERFRDQRVEARKDIGATGRHAVIEITGERHIRDKVPRIAMVTPLAAPAGVTQATASPARRGR